MLKWQTICLFERIVMKRERTKRMEEMSHIICAGRSVPVEGQVVLPDQHCLIFRKWTNWRPRKGAPDRIVLHWTGGEGSGPQVFQVLKTRGLSIHFVVDGTGTIWQFLDPASDHAYHAGRVENPRSIGIEVSCYGFRRWPRSIPEKGADRKVYPCTIHGRPRHVADYRPEQHKAIAALCSALCDSLGIPKRVHVDPRRCLSVAERKHMAGVIGHYHISPRKLDPGTRPLILLRDHWTRVSSSSSLVS